MFKKLLVYVYTMIELPMLVSLIKILIFKTQINYMWFVENFKSEGNLTCCYFLYYM
jgi:hypothetical protein